MQTVQLVELVQVLHPAEHGSQAPVLFFKNPMVQAEQVVADEQIPHPVMQALQLAVVASQ